MFLGSPALPNTIVKIHTCFFKLHPAVKHSMCAMCIMVKFTTLYSTQQPVNRVIIKSWRRQFNCIGLELFSLVLIRQLSLRSLEILIRDAVF